MKSLVVVITLYLLFYDVSMADLKYLTTMALNNRVEEDMLKTTLFRNIPTSFHNR